MCVRWKWGAGEVLLTMPLLRSSQPVAGSSAGGCLLRRHHQAADLIAWLGWGLQVCEWAHMCVQGA